MFATLHTPALLRYYFFRVRAINMRFHSNSSIFLNHSLLVFDWKPSRRQECIFNITIMVPRVLHSIQKCLLKLWKPPIFRQHSNHLSTYELPGIAFSVVAKKINVLLSPRRSNKHGDKRPWILPCYPWPNHHRIILRVGHAWAPRISTSYHRKNIIICKLAFFGVPSAHISNFTLSNLFWGSHNLEIWRGPRNSV